MDGGKQCVNMNFGVAIAGNVIYSNEQAVERIQTEDLRTMRSRYVRDLARVRKQMLPWAATFLIAGLVYLYALEETWLSMRGMWLGGIALIIYTVVLYRVNSVRRDVESIIMTKLRSVESELYMRDHGINE